VAVPNSDAATGTTSLRTDDGPRTNVATQDVCPGNLAEHLALGTYDDVGWALALDALEHPGPAVPGRVDAAECAKPLMPGVNPATFPTDMAANTAEIVRSFAATPQLREEPPLKCFVLAAGCGAATAGSGAPTAASAAPPRVGSPAIRATRSGRVRLKVRCAAACSGTVVLRRAGRTLGRRAFRAPRAATFVVPVRLDARARRSLRRTARQRVEASVGAARRTMVVGRPPLSR